MCSKFLYFSHILIIQLRVYLFVWLVVFNIFFSCPATKRGGGGVRAPPIRKKNFFYLFAFPWQRYKYRFNQISYGSSQTLSGSVSLSPSLALKMLRIDFRLLFIILLDEFNHYMKSWPYINYKFQLS